ncbi:unnamed protein product, partial [Symbiodinium microadriaticum]
MRNVVFPRAAEEARELFRAGQRQGRSLGGGGTFQDRRHPSSNHGTRSRAGSKGYGKGKGKGFTRRVYIAEDEAQFAYNDAYHQEDEDAEEYDDTSYPALGDEIDYEPHSYPAAEEEEDPEDEALALNCLEELDPEEAESGHAIQLQLAANAAFGKAKGRKGKGRGKGKGKGKVVRSRLTLDERRDKMKALKAKSKCLRCGAIGHWAGNPECKFPNQKGGKHRGKSRANIAIVAPRQDPDGGLYVPSGNDEDLCGDMMTELRSKAAPSPPSSSMQMEGGDRRFNHGQHKGMTFEEVSRKAEFVKWALLQPSIPEATYNPRPRGKGPKKVPPNPPKAMAQEERIHPAALHEWLREAIELDDALEWQTAEEEAQRELDEAFARARQQIAGEEEPDSITVLESATAPANKLQVRHAAGTGWERTPDREEENRAQADAWHRRRDTILAEAHARMLEAPAKLLADHVQLRMLEAPALETNLADPCPVEDAKGLSQCFDFFKEELLVSSAALQRDWLDDVGTVIRVQLAKLREMKQYPWEKQATATQREMVRQLPELMSDAGGNLESQEEVGPTSASLALVAPTVSFGSSRDSQESPTVPEPIVREHSFMEGAEDMALEAVKKSKNDRAEEKRRAVSLAVQDEHGYRNGPFDFEKLGVLTASDASFAGESNNKSQQGRIHFFVPEQQLRDASCSNYDVMVVSFASTTIKSVCRATLQAEMYALQSAQESGDRIRAALAEVYGFGSRGPDWEQLAKTKVPHVCLTDCRSLADHLNTEAPARVQDKRLQIELSALRQSIFTEDGSRTFEIYLEGGDRVDWIDTSTQAADSFTKSMKPDFIIK